MVKSKLKSRKNSGERLGSEVGVKSNSILNKLSREFTDFCNHIDCLRLLNKGIQVTDDFLPVEVYLNLHRKSRSANKVIELMCHPGHLGYREETALLNDPLVWESMGLDLINYQDLF